MSELMDKISLASLIGVIAVLGVCWRLVVALGSVRRNIAEEIKREIATQAEATRVDVQQPLTVTPHIDFVSKPDYERDQRIVDARLTSATESRKQLHEEQGRHAQRIAALEKSERHTEIALANIDQKLTTILQRLPK